MSELSIREHADLMAEVRAGAILAAPRDASFYSSRPTGTGPRSHCGGRYHALTENERARCNSRVLLILDLARPPASVSDLLLCRRPACVRAWLAAKKEESC